MKKATKKILELNAKLIFTLFLSCGLLFAQASYAEGSSRIDEDNNDIVIPVNEVYLKNNLNYKIESEGYNNNSIIINLKPFFQERYDKVLQSLMLDDPKFDPKLKDKWIVVILNNPKDADDPEALDILDFLILEDGTKIQLNQGQSLLAFLPYLPEQAYLEEIFSIFDLRKERMVENNDLSYEGLLGLEDIARYVRDGDSEKDAFIGMIHPTRSAITNSSGAPKKLATTILFSKRDSEGNSNKNIAYYMLYQRPRIRQTPEELEKILRKIQAEELEPKILTPLNAWNPSPAAVESEDSASDAVVEESSAEMPTPALAPKPVQPTMPVEEAMLISMQEAETVYTAKREAKAQTARVKEQHEILDQLAKGKIASSNAMAKLSKLEMSAEEISSLLTAQGFAGDDVAEAIAAENVTKTPTPAPKSVQTTTSTGAKEVTEYNINDVNQYRKGGNETLADAMSSRLEGFPQMTISLPLEETDVFAESASSTGMPPVVYSKELAVVEGSIPSSRQNELTQEDIQWILQYSLNAQARVDDKAVALPSNSDDLNNVVVSINADGRVVGIERNGVNASSEQIEAAYATIHQEPQRVTIDEASTTSVSNDDSVKILIPEAVREGALPSADTTNKGGVNSTPGPVISPTPAPQLTTSVVEATLRNLQEAEEIAADAAAGTNANATSSFDKSQLPEWCVQPIDFKNGMTSDVDNGNADFGGLQLLYDDSYQYKNVTPIVPVETSISANNSSREDQPKPMGQDVALVDGSLVRDIVTSIPAVVREKTLPPPTNKDVVQLTPVQPTASVVEATLRSLHEAKAVRQILDQLAKGKITSSMAVDKLKQLEISKEKALSLLMAKQKFAGDAGEGDQSNATVVDSISAGPTSVPAETEQPASKKDTDVGINADVQCEADGFDQYRRGENETPADATTRFDESQLMPEWLVRPSIDFEKEALSLNTTNADNSNAVFGKLQLLHDDSNQHRNVTDAVNPTPVPVISATPTASSIPKQPTTPAGRRMQETEMAYTTAKREAKEQERQRLEAERLLTAAETKAKEQERQRLEVERLLTAAETKAKEQECQRLEAERLLTAAETKAKEQERQRLEAEKAEAERLEKAKRQTKAKGKAKADRQKKESQKQASPSSPKKPPLTAKQLLERAILEGHF